MRYFYWLLIILFTTLVLVFKLQNFETVTITFLSMRATLPLALLVIGVYVLGMTTGGLLTTVLRHWFKGANISAAEPEQRP